MKTKIKDVGDYLKSNGVKPSYQRIKVFEYLAKYRNHPTVDTIYKALVPKIPTLSKTTVYNTLNIFIEKKIARVVIIEENETRYDADISIHGHFKCGECATVYDLDIDLEKVEVPALQSHHVSEYHFDFKGVCAECMPAGNPG
ncbi:MAG: transcriptional repressor [bacterium]|nr:transcriptional repressor [bacterium]